MKTTTFCKWRLTGGEDCKEEGKDQELIQSSTNVPHLTRDTIWESYKNTRKHHTQESQEVSPFPVGDHKATRNRQDSIIKTNVNINNEKDPQKKHHL